MLLQGRTRETPGTPQGKNTVAGGHTAQTHERGQPHNVGVAWGGGGVGTVRTGERQKLRGFKQRKVEPEVIGLLVVLIAMVSAPPPPRPPSKEG